MRVALFGLALLAVASAMHIPADDVHTQKRFFGSLKHKIKDLLPSQHDIDKLKDKLENAKDALKDKLEDAKDSLKDKLEDAKDKLDDAKDSLKDKLQGAKVLINALGADEVKTEQKRFWKDWVDKIKDILPDKTDIEKLKNSIDGVFPAVDDAAAGKIKDLFNTVEDQTKAVTQFKDLFANLNEDTIVEKFGKMYPYEDSNGKNIGVKNWVATAVEKVQKYYKDYVPADIMAKINEVKVAAADKDDKKRLPSAVLKLFCELLQKVGLLVINYAIGLPI